MLQHVRTICCAMLSWSSFMLHAAAVVWQDMELHETLTPTQCQFEYSLVCMAAHPVAAVYADLITITLVYAWGQKLMMTLRILALK